MSLEEIKLSAAGLSPDIVENAQNVKDVLKDAGFKPDVLGLYLAENFEVPGNEGTWSLDRVFDRMWGHVFKNTVVPNLLKIYESLVLKNKTEKKPFVFDDGDCSLWYIPCPKKKDKDKKVFVYTSNHNGFLFVINGGPDLMGTTVHIRQFWREYDPTEKYGLELKTSVEQQIRYSHHFEDYSDDIAGNIYISRPSLNTFAKSDYEPVYGDGRDCGYIATYQGFHNSVASALRNNHLINSVVGMYITMVKQTSLLKKPSKKKAKS